MNKPKNHRDLDFFDYCFVTDLSAANAPNRNMRKTENTRMSIENRVKDFFTKPFFRKFPVTILCCGHYVKEFEIRPDCIFGIPFVKVIEDKNHSWINFHYTDDKVPRVLLHTKHLTARGLKVNDYIDKIGELCSGLHL